MSQDSNSNSAPGAVLNEQQWNAITQAIAGLNREQLTWVSGYAAGMAAAQGGSVAPMMQGTPAVAGDAPTLTILYGSQTGNAKGVAAQCQAKAEEAGFNSKLVSMADYKPRNLKAETAVDMTLQVGYRNVTVDIEDLDDVYADMEFDGVFAGLELHF